MIDNAFSDTIMEVISAGASITFSPFTPVNDPNVIKVSIRKDDMRINQTVDVGQYRHMESDRALSYAVLQSLHKLLDEHAKNEAITRLESRGITFAK